MTLEETTREQPERDVKRPGVSSRTGVEELSNVYYKCSTVLKPSKKKKKMSSEMKMNTVQWSSHLDKANFDEHSSNNSVGDRNYSALSGWNTTKGHHVCLVLPSVWMEEEEGS